MTLVLFGAGSDLLAQERGTLQVTARVVASGPAGQALAAAVAPVPVLPPPERRLFTVRAETRAPAPGATAADRPRRVVTIEFLSN